MPKIITKISLPPITIKSLKHGVNFSNENEIPRDSSFPSDEY